jgi:hypothetical protein
MESHKLDNPTQFIFAGNSTFTVLNSASGNRFTFKVSTSKNDDSAPFFVKVLRGNDNVNDYSYIGHIFKNKQDKFYHGKKSKVSSDAQSVQVASWLFSHLNNLDKFETIEIFHEGRCGKCGRKLTTPESVKSGIGPECAKRM